MGAIKGKPKGQTIDPLYVREALTSENNKYYVIEGHVQRRYKWCLDLIRDFITTISNTVDTNKESEIKMEDNVFVDFYDIIISETDDKSGDEFRQAISIIDGGQRLITSYATIMALCYILMEKQSITDVNERRKFVYKYVKTKNEKHFKLNTTFRDDDIKCTTEEIIMNSLKLTDKIVETTINGLKNERNDKHFKNVVIGVYGIINDIFDVNTDFNYVMDIFLDKMYFFSKKCPKELKKKTFIEINKKRQTVENTDIYKTLINGKEEQSECIISGKYDNLVEYTNDIKKKGLMVDLKRGTCVLDFIMQSGLKYIDRTEQTLKDTFYLDNNSYGIEYQLDNGILKDKQGTVNFLDVCADICSYLNNSMMYSDELYNDDYFFTQLGKKRLWWHVMLPLYVIHHEFSGEKHDFLYDVLMKSWTCYNIRYTISSHIQYYQKFLAKFTYLALLHKDDDIMVLKSVIKNWYNEVFYDLLNKDMDKAIKRLNYTIDKDKQAIRSILSTIEYSIYKNIGSKTNMLYNFIEEYNNSNKIKPKDGTPKGSKPNKVMSIDHIIPQSYGKAAMIDENVINSIGNLTLLELTLNQKKSDDITKNREIYLGSKYLSTNLLNNDNSFINLSTLDISKVNNLVKRYDETEINNFSKSDIEHRTDFIVLKMIECLKIN